jgi:hypothetical protein
LKPFFERRIGTYLVSVVVAVVLWLFGAWLYRMVNVSQEVVGTGGIDRAAQFIAGGWPSDLAVKGPDGRNVQDVKTAREALSYLISASFIIQGLLPSIGAIGILAELIQLNRKRPMRAAGLLLEQQEMMADDFREAMTKFMGLDPKKAEDKERIAQLDTLTQHTAYGATKRWCEHRLPMIVGKAEAKKTLADLEDVWKQIG